MTVWFIMYVHVVVCADWKPPDEIDPCESIEPARISHVSARPA